MVITYWRPESTSKEQTQVPQEITADSADLHRSPDAKLFKIGPSAYRLESGSVIFHPLSPSTIEINHCKAIVRPRAAALISTDSAVSRVIDLFDSHFGCIKIQAGQVSRRLGPGGELAVMKAGSKEEAQELLLLDNLRRRKEKVDALPAGQFVIQDQVSIVDASLKEPMLGTMRRSTDVKDKTLSKKILKTAAALYLTESSEPYTVHQ